jgi:polyisoprenoid-binding protein YceI
MSWSIDSAHTSITFSVRHMMISNVHGRFENVEGIVDFNPENPGESNIDVKIDASSIDTREQQRDNHLRSPDFLDVEKYPYILFRSSRIEKTSPSTGKVYGELTIHGETRQIVLEVEYAGQAKSPFGTTSAGFTATTQINRKDWGLGWNVALETGGWLVGDKINVNIEVEIVKQEAPQKQQAAA